MDFDVYQGLGPEGYHAVSATQRSFGSIKAAITAWYEFRSQLPAGCPIPEHEVQELFDVAYNVGTRPARVRTPEVSTLQA
jgi:hypothetical protein